MLPGAVRYSENMARRRFFVDGVVEGRAELTGDEARHLEKVLRAEPGRRYEISDNRDLYLAEIGEAGRGRVVFHVVERMQVVEPPVRLVLLASLIKFDRFEWMLEKATELCVAEVVPIEAARSEKGLSEAAGKRLERWRKIARESSQQARRARLPEIRPPQRLDSALAHSGLRYVLEEEAGAAPMLAALPAPGARAPGDSAALLLGPEGGWTAAERGALAASGWTPVSLGPCILRAETAAIAGLAILLNAWAAPG
jgi:16S rRNA (uracil1498-N3)-methyltransferase